MRGMRSDAHNPAGGGNPVTAGPSASADFWEPRFQAADPSWGREPSARLVELLPRLGLAPGRAWDLGCAHGGDALWLASLGWHVTATDVSATAVGRVAAPMRKPIPGTAAQAAEASVNTASPARYARLPASAGPVPSRASAAAREGTGSDRLCAA